MDMELSAKPDFAATRERWNHFWAGEMKDRPLVVAPVARAGCTSADPRHDRYFDAIHGRYDDHLQQLDRWLATTEFPAETIPFFGPDFGPDQYAAYFGAELECHEESKGTSWSKPIVDDWADFLPLQITKNNHWLKQAQEYSRRLAEHATGRYLVGICDLHSNADTLSALRGPDNLCMDFYDCPEYIEQAMTQVRRTYQTIYDTLYEAGGMCEATGTIGWIPFWCEGKYATIQCDFICMVSPAIARQYILPALEEEAEFLDHCIYHLDGPDALVHLDDILSIKAIDAIQWVPGAGQPPMHTWLEVLQKCQKAGKSLQIYGVGFAEIKMLSRKLSPAGLVYCVSGGGAGHEGNDLDGVAYVEEITAWLTRHT